MTALIVGAIVGGGALLYLRFVNAPPSHEKMVSEMAKKFSQMGQVTEAEAERVVRLGDHGRAGEEWTAEDDRFLAELMPRPRSRADSAGLFAQLEPLSIIRLSKTRRRPLEPELLKEVRGWVAVEKIKVHRQGVIDAVRIVGQLKVRELAPETRAVLATPDPEIKWRAAQALRRLGLDAPNVPVPRQWKGRENS